MKAAKRTAPSHRVAFVRETLDLMVNFALLLLVATNALKQMLIRLLLDGDFLLKIFSVLFQLGTIRVSQLYFAM